VIDQASAASDEQVCFEQCARVLQRHAWVVIESALPPALSAALSAQVREMTQTDFAAAGIGRRAGHKLDERVRRDQISWIEGATEAEREWLGWCSRLQHYLNQRLLMGLFSFESHFAHYAPGAFYRKHVDAFNHDGNGGGARRVLSLVAYLNPDWQLADGGELLIYEDSSTDPVVVIQPLHGTVVLFLSEEVPHEVAPALCDRYSIAGWFRVNGSSTARVDPPR
jgi:SM-20-related protein